MMTPTPEEMLKKIKEVAGEKWHHWVIEDSALYNKDSITGKQVYYGHGYECACGFRRINRENWSIGSEVTFSPTQCINPSHTDLNELFRLARKLFLNASLVLDGRNATAKIRKKGRLMTTNTASEAWEALLIALYKSL